MKKSIFFFILLLTFTIVFLFFCLSCPDKAGGKRSGVMKVKLPVLLDINKTGLADTEVVSPPLDIMIGQMIMVGFRGTDPEDRHFSQNRWFPLLRQQISGGMIGGVLISDYNIINRGQVRKLVGYLNSIECSQPLLIALDQEGGKVQRLSAEKGFSKFLSARETALRTQDEAFAMYRSMAKELSSFGINMNLGPVVDLELDPLSPAIGLSGRSFSPDAPVVTQYAREFINAHRQYNIITVLKHFPGHGSADADTHRGRADVTALWQEDELIPFKSLISSSHADAVMTAHIFNAHIDPSNPASLSREHIENVLREKLQFEGLVITDDLQMKAISKYYTFEEQVILAVQAGSDILLFANYFEPDIDIPHKAAEILKRAVSNGSITEKRIRDSYKRILSIKKG